jgi:C_GCAxxG_C_C family probable redox protein
MKQEEENAIKSFKSGLNCAQSVLTAYSEKLSFDKGLATSISCGFGGGMGRLQETCGAVTGAFMVIGIYNCQKYSDNRERKEKTYAMEQDFNKKFIAENKTTNCRSLLNSDLKTKEGMQYITDNNLFETVCKKCIIDSVKIIDELIQ